MSTCLPCKPEWSLTRHPLPDPVLILWLSSAASFSHLFLSEFFVALQGILAAVLVGLLLTRLVNPIDILLSVASLAYAVFLGQWAVPPRADLPSAGLTPRQQLKDFGEAQWFQTYFKVFRIAGVLIPLLYSIAGELLFFYCPLGCPAVSFDSWAAYWTAALHWGFPSPCFLVLPL